MRKQYLLMLFILFANCTMAQEAIDPRGLYFNRFSGGFSGAEYFQVIPAAIPGSYIMTDLFGGGFTAMVDNQGQIELANGVGAGQFDDLDNFTINPNIGGTAFTFVNNRVPMTTPEFLLELNDAMNNGSPLNGDWVNRFGTINPETGQADVLSEEIISLVVDGNTVRITDPAGNFVQGVFEQADRAIFREIIPNPVGRFASIPGSDSTFISDLVGTLEFENLNEYRLIFALQSRAPLGQQTQTLFQFQGARQSPLIRGDTNGDGIIDSADRDILESIIGLGMNDDGFNLAADLHQNGIIDQPDLSVFDSLDFAIDSGLSGAWANPATLGQGLMFDIFDVDGITQMFVAWFAYDIELPDGMTTGFGAVEHRWFTAQGRADGNTSELILSVTSGGIFDDPTAVESEPIGILTVSFSSCTQGTISYSFEDRDVFNTFPIQRLSPNTFCEEPGLDE